MRVFNPFQLAIFNWQLSICNACALAAILIVAPLVNGADDAATTFKSDVMPVLSARCVKCHGDAKQKAKVNLAGPRSLDQLRADAKLWFRVLEQIESTSMPPPDDEK